MLVWGTQTREDSVPGEASAALSASDVNSHKSAKLGEKNRT